MDSWSTLACPAHQVKVQFSSHNNFCPFNKTLLLLNNYEWRKVTNHQIIFISFCRLDEVNGYGDSWPMHLGTLDWWMGVWSVGGIGWFRSMCCTMYESTDLKSWWHSTCWREREKEREREREKCLSMQHFEIERKGLSVVLSPNWSQDFIMDPPNTVQNPTLLSNIPSYIGTQKPAPISLKCRHL